MTLLTAALLDGYLRDWVDLLVRWLHVIAAITCSHRTSRSIQSRR